MLAKGCLTDPHLRVVILWAYTAIARWTEAIRMALGAVKLGLPILR